MAKAKADAEPSAPEQVRPCFVVSLQGTSLSPGFTPTPPTDDQLRALADCMTPEVSSALLGDVERVTITLAKAHDAEAWIPVEAPEEDAPAE